MYESRKNPPLPRIHFLRRLALHVAGVLGLLLGSLLIGMAGYGYFEDMAWRDAFLNSAMLLSAAWSTIGRPSRRASYWPVSMENVSTRLIGQR